MRLNLSGSRCIGSIHICIVWSECWGLILCGLCCMLSGERVVLHGCASGRTRGSMNEGRVGSERRGGIERAWDGHDGGIWRIEDGLGV